LHHWKPGNLCPGLLLGFHKVKFVTILGQPAASDWLVVQILAMPKDYFMENPKQSQDLQKTKRSEDLLKTRLCRCMKESRWHHYEIEQMLTVSNINDLLKKIFKSLISCVLISIYSHCVCIDLIENKP
jgi:hypothetical protein